MRAQNLVEKNHPFAAKNREVDRFSEPLRKRMQRRPAEFDHIPANGLRKFRDFRPKPNAACTLRAEHHAFHLQRVDNALNRRSWQIHLLGDLPKAHPPGVITERPQDRSSSCDDLNTLAASHLRHDGFLNLSSCFQHWADYINNHQSIAIRYKTEKLH